MTRNEKIALGIGAGVVLFGGLALYFSATSSASPTATPQSTPPVIPPTTPPPQSFAPTESFAPITSPAPTTTPHLTPASQFPPSWNQFTPVVAGHVYLITLTSPTPVDWASIIKPNAIPGSFSGPYGHATVTSTQYTYSLMATVTHQVQNVMFLLGMTKYVDVSVADLGLFP